MPRRRPWRLDQGSVSEVAAARKDHRGARLLDRRDHVGVPFRSAGLDDGAHACVKGELRSVWKGEERIRGEDGAFELVTDLARLLEREAHGVDPAHLPRPDADRLKIPRHDDRVRDDVLADTPGEEHVTPARLVASLACTDLHRL